ncbi:MAG: hypothetical protein LBL49_02890 [Clostridiales Family XIII bacterium]|nr:hypothetical protein [Clostridiales Family XIII bacterium]
MFIYYALHRWPSRHDGGVRSSGGDSNENGKVIYLFGTESSHTEKTDNKEDKGEIPRDPPGNGD